ncbi:branched-chain amino acid transport system II carrier protein [Escherichia coli]
MLTFSTPLAAAVASLLAALIFIACLVTAVGLTCACAEFFAQYVLLSYRTLVFILGGFSMVVSNLGLSQLIQISVPVLTAIYPAVYRTGCIKFYTLMVA